jgi:hypothetical protein
MLAALQLKVENRYFGLFELGNGRLNQQCNDQHEGAHNAEYGSFHHYQFSSMVSACKTHDTGVERDAWQVVKVAQTSS